jgi:hypothetical protein
MELADLDLSKTYSYADYLKWTFDGRIELIKGKIFQMSPVPGRSHQKMSALLTAELVFFLKVSLAKYIQPRSMFVYPVILKTIKLFIQYCSLIYV